MLLWENYIEVLDFLSKIITPSTQTQISLYGSVSNEIRILFVDDSPTVRVSYRRLLVSNGYITDVASNVTEAMEKALNHSYDIIITDYFMPDANGDELCRQLRSHPRTAQAALAIITGTYLDKVIKDSLYAGATECMFKNEVDELFLARVAAMSRAVQTQKAIEKDRQRLEGILWSVGEGVFGVDTSGYITFINPTAKNILGYTNERALIGKSSHTLFHYANKDGTSTSLDNCPLQRAYQYGDTIENCELVFWHCSGQPILVECTIVPLLIGGKLEGSVIAFRDISQRKQLEEELIWQVNHDALTKLHNRFYFEKHLEQEFVNVKQHGTQSALLYLDLDRFKYINDTAGHTAGDRLLVEISRLLLSRVRDKDLLARLGGDEFAVILSEIERSSIYTVAENIRTLLNGYNFRHAGKDYQINCSIGICIIDKGTLSPEEALSNADLACNIAKRQGRNQTHIYVAESDEKIAMDLELGWSTKLRDALQNDDFIIHYQPIVPLADIDLNHLPREEGQLWQIISKQFPFVKCHYEVLIRMPGAEGEIIYPHAFLPTAERFNMIQKIDYWVLDHAMRELASQQQRRKDTVFAINLSGHTVDNQELSSHIKGLIKEYNLDPCTLIFEITETTAIANIDAARKFIHEISQLGCRFSLDDFGTGFSSFSHLRHLNVDYVKIDGQFIRGMANNSADKSIVSSINDIAHSLGKRTIAEYVESPEILRMLKILGVDYVQGFYISHPFSAMDKVNKFASGNIIPFKVR